MCRFPSKSGLKEAFAPRASEKEADEENLKKIFEGFSLAERTMAGKQEELLGKKAQISLPHGFGGRC